MKATRILPIAITFAAFACDSSEVDTPTDTPDGTTAAVEVREVVGTTGADVALESGQTVSVPEDALAEATEIVVTAEEQPPQPVVEGFVIAGEVLTLEPHGQAFDEPVTVSLPFTRDPAVQASRYAVMRLSDDSDTTWERVENAFPQADGTVTFTIQTFSIYAVVQRQDECVLVECDEDESGFAARYTACLATTEDADYCADWIGCSGSFETGAGSASGTGNLCDSQCATDPCVNGTCVPGVDGGADTCLCDGGFEGETCDTASDLCPGDPVKTVPGVCGCGAADTDGDEDQTPDCLDSCPSDNAKTEAGVCGCGTADTDTDSDETPDCNDACPSDPNKVAAGVCGCGTADTDSDSDQTPDCDDMCPNDPNKTMPGECGCGEAEVMGCPATCPCFDSADVNRYGSDEQAVCVPNEQGNEFTFTRLSGFSNIENSEFGLVEARSFFNESDYQCVQGCGEVPHAGCTESIQDIGFDEWDACRALIIAHPVCQAQLP